MFKNYIKTAFRSLYKNRAFTAINIFGLALGLTACLLIVLYVVDELSYDRYNLNSQRIFRVNEDLKLGANSVQYALSMPPLAKTLKEEFPYVEDAVRIKMVYGTHVKKGNANLVENHMAFADPSLFKIFTLPMLSGSSTTALAEPNSVVMTESTAKKYFNTINAVGKTLLINDKDNFKVTAVIKDIPSQSHFNFDFLLSMSSYPDSRSNEWLRSDYNTYVLLKNKNDAKKLEASFASFLQKFSGAQMQSDLGMSYAKFEQSGSYFKLNLIALTDIHLHAKLVGEFDANGSAQYVYIFSAIAIFILLIACVNFMNLSTARSSNRAREVGVRKVLGSSRKHLIAQFLSESIMVTFFATIIALLLAYVLLPLFNQIAGKEIVLHTQLFVWLVPVSVALVLIIGSIAGSYPAFYLSAFQPIAVLKGKLSSGFRNSALRNFLVVFQFSISVFLIIGTLVIFNQLKYIQTTNLGYNRNQVLILQNSGELGTQAKTLKDEITQLPGVSNATMTGYLPTSGYRGTQIYFKDATVNQKESLFPQSWGVDADWIPTLGMKIVAGRNFSNNNISDSSAIIINESAAKFLGFKDLNNKVLYRSLGGKQQLSNTRQYRVIGIVKDFHFSSLHNKIEPLVLTMENNSGAISIRVNTKNIPGIIAQIKSKWATFSPVQMNYSFMDQDFDYSYRSEQRIGTIFIVFTTLAIVIACLGLFGLAAYAAEQRTKEIGIRKVLGANISVIVGMLSKDFIKLVCIAVIIASPIAWYLMQLWLQDFAYRISIQWWVIAAAGAGALVIAFATISFQSVKAAMANPVNSLKNE